LAEGTAVRVTIASLDEEDPSLTSSAFVIQGGGMGPPIMTNT